MAELVAVLRFEQVEVVVEGIRSPFLLVKPSEQVFVVRIDSERVARCEQSNFFHSPDLSRVIAFGSSVSRSSEVSALNFSRNGCWTFSLSYPVHVRCETVMSVLNSASIGSSSPNFAGTIACSSASQLRCTPLPRLPSLSLLPVQPASARLAAPTVTPFRYDLRLSCFDAPMRRIFHIIYVLYNTE